MILRSARTTIGYLIVAGLGLMMINLSLTSNDRFMAEETVGIRTLINLNREAIKLPEKLTFEFRLSNFT